MIDYMLIVLSVLYIIANIGAFIGRASSLDIQPFEFTLGCIVFPAALLPDFFKFLFNTPVFRTKVICKCPTCGTGHKTFKDKFNELGKK